MPNALKSLWLTQGRGIMTKKAPFFESGDPAFTELFGKSQASNPNTANRKIKVSDDKKRNITNGLIKSVPTEQVILNPHQPRLSLDNEHLLNLMQSIDKNGMDYPPRVVDAHGTYIIISGHSRYEACVKLGCSELDVIVDNRGLDYWTDLTLFVHALHENNVSQNLSDFENSCALLKLTNEFGFTSKEAAAKAGINWNTARSLMLLVAESTPELLRRAIKKYPSYFTSSKIKNDILPIIKGISIDQAEDAFKCLEQAGEELWATKKLCLKLKEIQKGIVKKALSNSGFNLKHAWGNVSVSKTSTGVSLKLNIKNKDNKKVNITLLKSALDEAYQQLVKEGGLE